MPSVDRILLFGILLAAAPAVADEDLDLNLIPKGIPLPQQQQQPGPEHATAPAAATAGTDTSQRIYIENAVTVNVRRDHLLVPTPAAPPPDWQERLFIDARRDWNPVENLTLTYSGRLGFRAENDISFPSHENIRHDFREGYASWAAFPGTYLDAGRINLKSGVAVGYNPTDFFKTRAVVEPLSFDPAVLRENRLGTLMARAQHIWDGGAFSVAFAPKIYDPSPIYSNTNLPSFDPMFDRTNAHDRLLLKGSVDFGADISPEFLLYHEADRTQVGANITRSIGQSVVAYAEWAGGRRASLIDDALRYGRQTGTLPAGAPSALPESSKKSFQNDLTVGLSYTTESKITFNLEYQFHQAGFSGRDWDNWFNIGQSRPSLPVRGQLWYIRSYALDQQEPLSQNYLFLRADWVDAFVRDLELTGFIRTDLHDGSSLIQVTADYYLSNAWTIGALAAANIGGRHSDFGSLPQEASIIFKLARYF